MNSVLKFVPGVAHRAVLLVGMGLLLRPALVCATEETFETLQIGTQTYQNVTVTTKTRDKVFLMHSAGMNTVKVADLSPEVRKRLGYEGTDQKKGGVSSVSTWTRNTAAKWHLPEMKQLEQQWRTRAPGGLATVRLTSNLLYSTLGAIALMYVLMCYCGMLICQKTGNPPGLLVWIPVLQLIPLLRAAGMSPAWLLAFLVPVLNIIAQVLWSFNIAKAREKSPWVGLFLILPVTSFFAYLYLALSGAAQKKEEPVVEIMTLEVA